MTQESKLDMAERHVREGEERVARQCELVDRMRAGGHDTKQAEDLLAEFEALLSMYREHLKAMRIEHGLS